MSNTATLQATLTYTPPGGTSNSATASLSVSSSYTAMSAGNIDIPNLTGAATVFAVPFGTVAEAKMLVVQNTNNQDMGIRLAGAVANEYQQPPGGELIIAHPIAAQAVPLAAAAVVTTAIQSGAGLLRYFVFGT